ncbi:MAG: DUF2267 domain-containing protein [Armatimonadetes bacterium]|nr:DUF2267 domain-containing protein [Armatimonadota bacterium]
MQAEEFIKNVEIRGNLRNRDEARKAIEAVLDTLRARITPDTVDNVASQLPHYIQQMWRQGFIERMSRMVVGPEKRDLGGFIARVASEFGTEDMGRAEAMTRAVFITLREQTTPGAQHNIEQELPEDIREFWLESSPPVMPKEKGPAAAHELEEVGMVGRVGGAALEFEAPVVPTEAEEPCQWIEPPTPAVDRIADFPPPSEYESVEGPGSEIHYRSDPQLTEEIEEMLRSSAEVDAERISVFVQSGNVTLRGEVKSDEERRAAAVVVSKALGVGQIRNELTVEGRPGDTTAGPGEHI